MSFLSQYRKNSGYTRLEESQFDCLIRVIEKLDNGFPPLLSQVEELLPFKQIYGPDCHAFEDLVSQAEAKNLVFVGGVGDQRWITTKKDRAKAKAGIYSQLNSLYNSIPQISSISIPSVNLPSMPSLPSMPAISIPSFSGPPKKKPYTSSVKKSVAEVITGKISSAAAGLRKRQYNDKKYD